MSGSPVAVARRATGSAIYEPGTRIAIILLAPRTAVTGNLGRRLRSFRRNDMKVARHFSAGKNPGKRPRPVGTLERLPGIGSPVAVDRRATGSVMHEPATRAAITLLAPRPEVASYQ